MDTDTVMDVIKNFIDIQEMFNEYGEISVVLQNF